MKPRYDASSLFLLNVTFFITAAGAVPWVGVKSSLLHNKITYSEKLFFFSHSENALRIMLVDESC